ncbi:MAG: signal transduction histidine kinase [Deltaproteobacteria bacterium]|jgi:two-component system NtrC family sensor kinase|nr:signal transduction histidine kinase [Deltaproteobacteria bacterium]
MSNKTTIRQQIEKNGLVLIAIVMVIIYWFLDSLTSEQTLTRSLIVVFVVIYGIFTQTLINSRKAALEEKERTQQRLIQSESLAAIGQLVAGIAHELNNPLASTSSLIQTDIELINEQKNKRDIDNELLSDLHFSLKELKRVEAIVKSVLGLSRQTQTYVEDVDINATIEDALRILHNQYKDSGVVIDKDYEEDLPKVNGNFANLGQVFINIIKNAFQSLPDGKGTIFLKTKYVNETNSVTIECRDTGLGIPTEVINDIFKPFFTTKEVGSGTGLGLYISHEIIKKHEGLISVSSKQGKGTTFTIDLPAKARA